MRIMRADSGKPGITFILTSSERDVLVHLLGSYPLVPAAHYQVSKASGQTEGAEWQQLLEQAVAEQRNSNRKQVTEWLSEPGRFETAGQGWKLTVKHEHREWLLQVFNDVRVGSWLLLGSPEKPLDPTNLDEKLVQYWIAMEISAWFQMALLSGPEMA